MTDHLDEMRHFMHLCESTNPQSIELPIVEEEAVAFADQTFSILEDIQNILFKLQSHRIDEASVEYNNGLEEGIILASNMLHRILERHGNTRG